MTVIELKTILEEYSDETEVNAIDENGNSYDFDEVVIYNPALSCESTEKNYLTLPILKRDN